MRTTRRRWGLVASLLWVALLELVLGTTRASATPFAFVGPRPVGMGGAGVAATQDAHAIYWNPAGLAMTDSLDIRLSGTIRASVSRTLDDAIDEVKAALDSGDAPEEIRERIEAALSGLEGNLSGGTTGGGGLFLKGNWEENAFGFAYLDVFNGTASLPVIDPRLQIIAGKVFNGSVVALDGLEGRQIAFSYARSILEKTASVGFTVSALQGVAYLNRSFIQEGETGLGSIGDYDFSESDWEPSVDAGVTWNPTKWLRFAIVGKYLNRPTFDVIDPSDVEINGTPPDLPPAVLDAIRAQLARAQGRFELAPQGRASFATFPLEGMTITADVDVTPNPTFIDGIDSQLMSFGGEQLFLDDLLAARLGVYYDFQIPHESPVPTIGGGVSFHGFTFDIAGAYDFDKSSGGVAIGFGYTM